MMKKSQQRLKPLPPNVRSVVRSGIAINSVAQCIEELVYNSKDAGAGTINISVNIDRFKVTVEDDGVGLNEADLEVVGDRYMTSKCHSIEDLNKLKHYGYRGEALASIIEASGAVSIVTRPRDLNGVEFRKKFDNGKVSGFVEKYNSCNQKPGTKIIIDRLLSKFPVRQNRIDKSIQMEEIKVCLERIALINPNLNISLSNEAVGNLVLSFESSTSYSQAFDQLYRSTLGFNVNFTEENFLFQNLFFDLSLSTEYVKRKSYQCVFVNNRFIQRCRIHKWVGYGILDLQRDIGSPKFDKYPIFILNITCCLSEYDITIEPKKQLVEFKDWHKVQSGIEGLVNKIKAKKSFAGNNRCGATSKNPSTELSSFDIKGAVHSSFALRNEEKPSSIKSKSSTSDKGSHGEVTYQIPNIKGQNNRSRNLARTGSNCHVVNIRELRKRRITGNAPVRAANLVVPKLIQRVDNRPKLTLGVFKKFSEWGNVCGDTGPSAVAPFKRARLANDGLIDEPSVSKTVVERAPFPPPTVKSTFDWKMKRFLESDGEEQEIDNISVGDTLSSFSSGNRSRWRDGQSSNGPSPLAKERRCKSVESIETSIENSPESVKVIEDVMSRTDAHVKSLVEKWNVVPPKQDIFLKINEVKKMLKENHMKKLKTRRKSAPSAINSSLKRSETESKEHVFKKPRKINSAANLGNIMPTSEAKQCESSEVLFSKNKVSSSKPNLPFTATEDKTRQQELQPVFNLFFDQKCSTSKSDEKVLKVDHKDADSEADNMFPLDLPLEIVSDSKGQEWLQTVDDSGKNVYINLSNGESSHDMVHVFGSLKKISVGEIKNSNPVRYNWLRKHFPQGFRQFWNGSNRDLTKEGDLSKMSNSLIRNSVLQCVQSKANEAKNPKWKDGEKPVETETFSFSKYFNAENPEVDEQKNKSSNKSKIQSSSLNELQSWKNFATGTSTMRFSKEDLNNVFVIGQHDSKFILATLRKSLSEMPTLVIFDQHAVHERIRLEKFIAESSRHSHSVGKRCLVQHDINPRLFLSFTESDIRVIMRFRQVFWQNGILCNQSSATCVEVKSAPKCFIVKVAAEPMEDRKKALVTLVSNLIKEVINHVLATNGATLTGLPKTVNEVLCSQACHGAIKFGDALDRSQCQQLISELSSCKNPFQCAHGRPTVVPLIKSTDMTKYGNCKTSSARPILSGVKNKPEGTSSTYFGPKDQDATSGYFSFQNKSSERPTFSDLGKRDFSGFSRAELFKKLQTPKIQIVTMPRSQPKSEVTTPDDDDSDEGSHYFS